MVLYILVMAFERMKRLSEIAEFSQGFVGAGRRCASALTNRSATLHLALFACQRRGVIQVYLTWICNYVNDSKNRNR